MRSAISPRLAIRIFLNIAGVSACLPAANASGLSRGSRGRSFDAKQGLAKLDRFAVRAKNLPDGAGRVGLDLVHDLHGFDDADRLAQLESAADFAERLRSRAGRAIEGPDHRRLHDMSGGGWRLGPPICLRFSRRGP